MKYQERVKRIDDDTVELNCEYLDALAKAFKKKPPVTRVGILGSSKNKRKGDGPTNSEIGAKFEYGDSNTAGGSFLRVPISDHLEKYMARDYAFSEKTIIDLCKTMSLRPYMLKIGLLCEQIVAEAFKTSGFGKWKISNMKYKKVKQTLVETTQLRDSITSDTVASGES